jgi:hypothetical protein
MSSTATIFYGALASIVLVVSALGVVNLLREGLDLDAAAERTVSGLSGLITGIAGAGIVIGGEFVGALSAILLSAPDAIIQLVLGAFGYLSISGIVELQPETWGLLVVIAVVVGVVLRDYGM